MSSILFELDGQIGKQNPNEKSLYDASNPHQWLVSLMKAKRCYDKKLLESIGKDNLELLNGSIVSEQTSGTHNGLIQYIFCAWAKEIGVVLRPDMFFSTIISEIKNEIIKNSKKYAKLLTFNPESKETIVVVNLSVENLLSELQHRVPSKQLFDIVTNTKFTSEPEHFKTVMYITMADMGTPYFSYETTRCGIPKILVNGNKEDWQILLDSIVGLLEVFKDYRLMNEYLTTVKNLVEEFITATFKNKDYKFFENMFIYGEDPHSCRSGHELVMLDGWIKDLYVCNRANYITDYPSHISCLPYSCKDDPDNIQYYFYMAGLFSSKIIGDFLHPEYNIIHCKLNHPDNKAIFNILACN